MFGSGSNDATSSQALALHLLRQVLEKVTGLDVRLDEWKLRTVAKSVDRELEFEYMTINIKDVLYYISDGKCCGHHSAEFLLHLKKSNHTNQWEPDNSAMSKLGSAFVSTTGYGKFLVCWKDYSQLTTSTPVSCAAREY